MKRILTTLIALMGVCVCFVACSSKEEPEQPSLFPVSGLSVPATAYAGESFEIKGSGFPADSKVSMEKEGAARIQLAARKTAGGLSCSISSNVEGGSYHLFLTSGQNEWPMGSGTLKVIPALPVVGLSFPVKVEAGSSFLIKGAGFPADSKIQLFQDGQLLDLPVKTVSAGLECSVDASVKPGKYELVLCSGENSWNLAKESGKELEVIEPKPAKQISSIYFTAKELENFPIRTIDFSYDGQGTLTRINDPSIMNGYDRAFAIQVTGNSVTGENTEKMARHELQRFAIRIQDGVADQLVVTTYPEQERPALVPELDEKGIWSSFLMKADQPFKLDDFLVFEGTLRDNNPAGPDITALLVLLNIAGDQPNILSMAYLQALGLAGAHYPSLPSQIKLPVQKEDGSFDFVSSPVKSPEYDRDGYVTGLQYKDPTLGTIECRFSYR